MSGRASGNPRTREGNLLPLEDLPLGVAFREGRPAHLPMRITGGDGVVRDIEVTAFPLCAQADVILGCDRRVLGAARPGA